MSGPGWMPSRPRPLGQVRRRLVSYASHLRRAARKARAAQAESPTQPPCGVPVSSAVAANDAVRREARVFASRRARLPVATLLPHRSEGRPRVVTGAVHRWLGHRWLWVQPRLIPLIVAFVGLIATLNARRYLLELARGPAVACPATEVAHASPHATPATPAPASHGEQACQTTRAARIAR